MHTYKYIHPSKFKNPTELPAQDFHIVKYPAVRSLLAEFPELYGHPTRLQNIVEEK